MRLNKYISESGRCSRREADKWIEAGRVTCNGVPAVLGTRVTGGDEVRVDGELIGAKQKQIYIALNKPVGITCTTELHIKDNIIDLVGHSDRIFPIGRLDKDSEGLILLTNNGDIVNELLRSENNHEKEYIVTVNRPITDLALSMMEGGVKIAGAIDQAMPGDPHRPGSVSHHSHSRTESADPPHVFGAGLPGAAPATRAHPRHSTGRFAAGRVASPGG